MQPHSVILHPVGEHHSHNISLRRMVDGRWWPVPAGTAFKRGEIVRIMAGGLKTGSILFEVKDPQGRAVYHGPPTGSNYFPTSEAWLDFVTPPIVGEYQAGAQSSDIPFLHIKKHWAWTNFKVSTTPDPLPIEVPPPGGIKGILGDIQGIAVLLIIGMVVYTIAKR